MDHTDYHIKVIDFGNLCLDRWLKDEIGFISSLNNSKPLRFCLSNVYKVLADLNELPIYWKARIEKQELIRDAIIGAKEWAEITEDSLIEDLTKSIMVLECLAEKRLKTTGGF